MQGIKHSFGNDSKSSHPNAEVSKRGHPVLASPTQPKILHQKKRDISRNPCEKHLDKLNFIQIYDIKT